MKEGTRVAYTIKDCRREGTIFKTSEGRFLRFVGEKSALIEFTKPDGSKIEVSVLVSKVKPVTTQETA